MPDLAVPTVAYLKGLPATVTLDVPGGKLLLCHGAGTDDMAQVLPHDRGHALASNEAWTRVLFDPDVRFMVCGHTHQAMLRQFARGSGRSPLVVVNAGSLARDAPPGFVVLDLARGTVDFHRIENGAPRRETCAVL
jgi:predicted phosphodiesterase